MVLTLIDGSFELFNSKICQLIDQYLSIVKLSKRQIKTRIKPWITQGICKSMSKRDFYLRKFIKAKDPVRKSNFHNSFKSYHNSIVSLCRHSKSNYFTAYLNRYSLDMQNVWSRVRSIISANVKPSSPILIQILQSLKLLLIILTITLVQLLKLSGPISHLPILILQISSVTKTLILSSWLL